MNKKINLYFKNYDTIVLKKGNTKSFYKKDIKSSSIYNTENSYMLNYNKKINKKLKKSLNQIYKKVRGSLNMPKYVFDLNNDNDFRISNSLRVSNINLLDKVNVLKQSCSVCGVKEAKWCYAPSYEGSTQQNSSYCGNCVPKGCSCNTESFNVLNEVYFDFYEYCQDKFGLEEFPHLNLKDKKYDYRYEILDSTINKLSKFMDLEEEKKLKIFDIVEKTYYPNFELLEYEGIIKCSGKEIKKYNTEEGIKRLNEISYSDLMKFIVIPKNKYGNDVDPCCEFLYYSKGVILEKDHLDNYYKYSKKALKKGN